jgi:hypothetical protein
MDFLLIGATLLLGLIGTIWKDPPYWAKIALIALLVMSSTTSVVKSIADDRDKELLQTLAVSGLTLPNAAYTDVFKPLKAWMSANGYNDGYNCHHTSDGMECSIDQTGTKPQLILVLSRLEVAKIYANVVRGRDNADLMEALAHREYDPSALSEDFKVKVGILGVGLFYDMCSRFPYGYDFDNSFGVTITFEDDGTQKTINLSPKEIIAVKAPRNVELFPEFVKLWNPKIKAEVHQCDHRQG